MDDSMGAILERIAVATERTARELKTMRELMIADVNARAEAESEVPERMRRFGMYMHDVHHIMWMDQENGQEPPEYVKAEARRCYDRYRQILAELNTDTGSFEKVRREMATDPLNRYDHVRQLLKPTHKGVVDETRKSNGRQDSRDEGGA
jgi:hypothetical protein